jgi:hypothetical protein
MENFLRYIEINYIEVDSYAPVHAECNSVLHSARPCVLHSAAGGPYITFMA